MRDGAKIAVLMMLCAATAFSQCERRIDGPPNFKIRTLHVEGLESLPPTEATSIRESIARLCFNNADDLTWRALDILQQRGYFKASVSQPRLIVKDNVPWPAAADVLLAADPGVQYRLREITFSGNKAINNNASLRALFPLRDGDILDIAKLRSGIKRLKDVYGEFGYANFTPIPDFMFDEQQKLATVKIEIDEGQQFFVEQVDIRAAGAVANRLVQAWYLKVGDIYNPRLVEMFFQRNRRWLPAGASSGRNVSFNRDQERAALTIVVNVCDSEKDCVVTHVPCREGLACVNDSAGIPRPVS